MTCQDIMHMTGHQLSLFICVSLSINDPIIERNIYINKHVIYVYECVYLNEILMCELYKCFLNIQRAREFLLTGWSPTQPPYYTGQLTFLFLLFCLDRAGLHLFEKF